MNVVFEHSFHLFFQVEFTSSTEKIYILAASNLPSHIRSVEVKHGTYRADLADVCCSTRSINIILILVFVLVTSHTVSIVVYKITEISDTGHRLQVVIHVLKRDSLTSV